MIFQLVSAAAVLLIALLLFLTVRQIGILSRRVRRRSSGGSAGGLPPGTRVPQSDLAAHDGSSTYALQAPGGGENHLLFASFSCALCRPVLVELTRLPSEIREKMILMMLDTAILPRYAPEIERWGLGGFRMVEAYEMAKEFGIDRAPYAMTVDEGGFIISGDYIVSWEDLSAFYQKHSMSNSPGRRAGAVSPVLGPGVSDRQR